VTQYGHAEAFALMKYASRAKSGPDPLVEYIWNSRDGVTPFGVLANPALGKQWSSTEMFHVDFGKDRYEPYWPHVGLKVGDRIFVDMTRGRAMDWAQERARIIQAADPDTVLSEHEVADVADSLMDDPDIIVVDALLLKTLQRNFPRPPVGRRPERFA
jgi:hypothetical protein